MGYAGNGPEYGQSILRFTDGSIELDSISIYYYLQDNNSAFSDSAGQLIAFSEGLTILNNNFQPMENGFGINVEVIPLRYYLSDDDLPQGSVFLPWPGKTDSVIMLYLSQVSLDIPNGLIDLACYDLSIAVIDTKANNGLGKVVGRDIPILHDTIQYGLLKPVKHANGRDWWLIIFEDDSKYYYRVLIDPDGVHVIDKQSVEFTVYDGLGSCAASPDGKQLVFFNSISASAGAYTDIFDFDRCTGLLSNQIQFKTPGLFGGIAISPNSRYLYQSLGDLVYQYDLYAPDIYNSRIVVATYDGFSDPFPVKFYLSQLAPDGRIYTCATNGTRYLHVIHRPDEPGLACQYEQHGIRLLKYNATSVPNFPNYRLGPLDGSPCDTLDLNNQPKAWYRYEQDSLDLLAVEFHDLSYYEPANWSWDFGDGSAGSTERHPTHLFPQPDAYPVCLTVSNQYGSDTHCKTLYLGVSAQDNPVLQSQVLVWPNPFGAQLAVALNATLRSPVFRLFDMAGRLLRQEHIGPGVYEIDTAELPPGMYFWEIGAEGERVKSGKVVKVK